MLPSFGRFKSALLYSTVSSLGDLYSIEFGRNHWEVQRCLLLGDLGQLYYILQFQVTACIIVTI